MAWSEKTWVAGELVTHSMMNSFLKANLDLLKTNIDNDGSVRHGIKVFAWGGTGQGNGAGPVDTPLTSYDTTIPAGFLSVAGAALVLEVLWVTSAQAGTKVAKLQLGGGTLATILSTTAVSTIILMTLILRGRTSTTGSISGLVQGSTANLAALTIAFRANLGLAGLTNGASQLLRFFANATVANELKLAELSVIGSRALQGATV
jgi:hypothetical protein